MIRELCTKKRPSRRIKSLFLDISMICDKARYRSEYVDDDIFRRGKIAFWCHDEMIPTLSPVKYMKKLKAAN
jgi:hypothetical protein